MAKRGNGEGTITKRQDGRWQARLTMPDGSRKTVYAKTQRECQRALDQLKRDRDDGLCKDSDQPFGKYLQSWLESRTRLGPRTRIRYESAIRCHINPSLGKVPLSKLAPGHIQKLYKSMRDSGQKEGSLITIYTVLSGSLNAAVRMGLIRQNIARQVESPKPPDDEHETLSSEEVRQLLQHVRGNRLEAMYVLAVTTGMREGELLGLQWRDVDLDAGLLTVRGNIQRYEHAYHMHRTKTKQTRTILLTQTAIEALKRHRIVQQQEKDELGAEAWDTTWDLVFSTVIGTPLHFSTVLKEYLRKQMERAGIPVIRNGKEFRFHDLRHTAATLLMEAGVHPKVVSEMLGHSDIAITIRTYTHITASMMQTAAITMDRIVGNNHSIAGDEVMKLRMEIARLRSMLGLPESDS